MFLLSQALDLYVQIRDRYRLKGTPSHPALPKNGGEAAAGPAPPGGEGRDRRDRRDRKEDQRPAQRPRTPRHRARRTARKADGRKAGHRGAHEPQTSAQRKAQTHKGDARTGGQTKRRRLFIAAALCLCGGRGICAGRPGARARRRG